jgi:hypothetical protein
VLPNLTHQLKLVEYQFTTVYKEREKKLMTCTSMYKPVACELLLYLEITWSKFCLVLGLLFPYHAIFRNYPGKN